MMPLHAMLMPLFFDTPMPLAAMLFA